MDEAREKNAAACWQKYEMLTREMLKFIGREDVDEFREIVEQRDRLQQQIEALGVCSYPHTEAGQALYERLQPMDMQIRYQAKRWLNQHRHQSEVVDGYGQPAGFIGHVFNRGF